MMAKVYRAEDAEGEGLWYGGGAFRLGWSNTENKRHPSPRTDPVLGPYFKRSILGGVYPVGEVGDYDDLRYAFTSIAQLIQWVPSASDREKLSGWGYVVNVYDAPDALIGDTQAVFDRATATKIETLSLINPEQIELNLAKEAA